MYKLRLLVLVCLTACCLSAQETRSTISGRVLDAHNAAIVGAAVRVTNTGTNVTVALTTNDTGYYEAALLLPGTYEVAAEAQGFRTAIRKGITLLMSAHADVDMHVEVGGVAESVTVVAEAPMLERSSSTSGRVFDNRTQQDLPVSLNSVTVLARLVPGVQSNGEVRMLGPADQGSSSDYHVGAGLGSNQFYLDGATNSGGTTVGHLPHADTVEEMKVETSGFDASFGQSLGVGVTVVSKSGTNRIHGSASDEYQSQRWNATDFFTRQHYYNNLAAARASGNQTLIQQASSAPLQPPGHENYWAGTVGGPVVIPKVLNGRNKLFFFADYVQRNKIATVAPASLNHTFPTLSERTGDFTDLLRVGSQYQIYDPLTVRADPARSATMSAIRFRATSCRPRAS